MDVLSKQQVLLMAVQHFREGDFPFTVERDGDRLVFALNWKDARIAGLKSISKETGDFVYVVELDGEKGTFYGYDIDEETYRRMGADGKFRMSGSSFVGHEIRFHKEAGLDMKDGMKAWEFSTEDIHVPVKEFFTGQGWKYKEPDLRMVSLTGTSALVYKGISTLFMIIGIAGSALFLSIGLWPALFLTGIFVLLGIWALGVGFGKAWMPVMSVKMTLKVVGLSFAISWGAVLVILFVVFGLKGGF